MSAPTPNERITLQILSVVFFNFVGYLTIGIPLAVIPEYVHNLGYGPVISGIAVSVQYIATFISRAPAGRLSDSRGPKRTVVIGLVACAISGLVVVISSSLAHIPLLCLGILFVARLALGWGESFVTTAASLWGIGLVGSRHTARVISWNGVATYSAIALGAPLGVYLQHRFGFAAIGWLVFVLATLSIPFALLKRASIPIVGIPIPIHKVFNRVLPYGTSLALGSLGFGTIATFITLYFASQKWANAAFCLSAFGLFFVAMRLLFAGAIDKLGGYRIALICFAVESAGLLLLGLATSMPMALAGATLTGIGFSLVFPALGVEAMGQVSADNRGAALAMYSVFVDVALGITGPLGGWIANHQGFGAIYVVSSVAAVMALGITWAVHHRVTALNPRAQN